MNYPCRNNHRAYAVQSSSASMQTSAYKTAAWGFKIYTFLQGCERKDPCCWIRLRVLARTAHKYTTTWLSMVSAWCQHVLGMQDDARRGTYAGQLPANNLPTTHSAAAWPDLRCGRAPYTSISALHRHQLPARISGRIPDYTGASSVLHVISCESGCIGVRLCNRAWSLNLTIEAEIRFQSVRFLMRQRSGRKLS